MKRLLLPSLLLSLFGLALVFFPAYAGSETGTKGINQSCQTSAQCQPDLRCEFSNNVDVNLSQDGTRQPPSGETGVCVAAFQNDGDDCNNYDCNRRFGMYCNSGFTAVLTGGFDFGECKRKGSAGSDCGTDVNCQDGLKCDPSSKRCIASTAAVARTCAEQFPNDTPKRQACEAGIGETCVAESECAEGLKCNTAETNLGGIFRSGRSGVCRLPSAVGGACEETADCVSGLSCNTRTLTCVAPAGADSSASGNAASTGEATTTTDEQGRPNFGLQWFRGQGTGLRTDSPQQFITGVVRTVLSILAMILVVLLVAGGIIYMTSAGNEKRVDQAKDIITNSIVGMVVVAAAFIIAELVIRALSA